MHSGLAVLLVNCSCVFELIHADGIDIIIFISIMFTIVQCDAVKTVSWFENFNLDEIVMPVKAGKL